MYKETQARVSAWPPNTSCPLPAVLIGHLMVYSYHLPGFQRDVATWLSNRQFELDVWPAEDSHGTSYRSKSTIKSIKDTNHTATPVLRTLMVCGVMTASLVGLWMCLKPCSEPTNRYCAHLSIKKAVRKYTVHKSSSAAGTLGGGGLFHLGNTLRWLRPAASQVCRWRPDSQRRNNAPFYTAIIDTTLAPHPHGGFVSKYYTGAKNSAEIQKLGLESKAQNCILVTRLQFAPQINRK